MKAKHGDMNATICPDARGPRGVWVVRWCVYHNVYHKAQRRGGETGRPERRHGGCRVVRHALVASHLAVGEGFPPRHAAEDVFDDEAHVSHTLAGEGAALQRPQRGASMRGR